MDVTNLILYLKGKITDQTLDQQMVSKVIRLLELGAVFTASTFSALPTPVGRSGELWYVLYDGLYWSTGDYWIPIAQISQSVAWSWGYNTQGQLGDLTTTSKSSPVSVVGGISDWCQIDAGGSHSTAIRINGSVWAWGCNGFGQLGTNNATGTSSPVSVIGGITDWCQVGAGGFHTVALRTNGSAWAWGANGGNLGDGTTTNKSSPVSVVGGFTDWCQISAGVNHTMAVRMAGSAWAWGTNSCANLGDNTTTARSSPVSVVGGFSDWCQVGAGSESSAAVRTNGTIWAWGNNYFGHLGDNTITSRSSPVSVVGGFTDWCFVDARGRNRIALRASGSMWAWGRGDQGQLGDNTTACRSSPVSVVGGFSDWCQASAGNSFNVAVRTNGTAWSWGCNGSGRLGDNTTVNKSSPVSVIGGCSDWFKVSAGGYFALAIRSNTL